MTDDSPAADRDAPPKPLAAPGLRKASPGDVHRLKTTLAEAFYDDPIFGWLMPDDQGRIARLSRFFAIQLRHVALPHGCTWTSGDLAGASLALPPGKWRTPPRAVLAHSSTFFGRHQARAVRLLLAIEAKHLREPHYYFADVGVRPQSQGKGLGSALMRPTLDRCDDEGVPAYLEASSERSRALYERLGFAVTRELRVSDSPPLWLMVRKPGASPSASALGSDPQAS